MRNSVIKTKILKKLVSLGYTITPNEAQTTRRLKSFTIGKPNSKQFEMCIGEGYVMFYLLPKNENNIVSRGVIVKSGVKFGYNSNNLEVDTFNELIMLTIDILNLPIPTKIL